MKRFNRALSHLRDSSRSLGPEQKALVTAISGLSDVADSKGDTARILESGTKAIRESQLKALGYRRRELWDSKAPMDSEDMSDRWIDHPYRLYKDGKKWYVSEPYQLSPAGMRDLISIEEKGWSVSITAWTAMWYPGHTIGIWIHKNKKDSMPT